MLVKSGFFLDISHKYTNLVFPVFSNPNTDTEYGYSLPTPPPWVDVLMPG